MKYKYVLTLELCVCKQLFLHTRNNALLQVVLCPIKPTSPGGDKTVRLIMIDCGPLKSIKQSSDQFVSTSYNWWLNRA